MAFSAVSVFKVGDEAGLQRWLLEHYFEHRLFTQTLLAQTPPVQTATFPIEKMDKGYEVAWLVAHNQMSQSVWTGIGGGQSADFSRVDWDDPEQLNSWLDLHSAWHQQVRDTLSL